MTCLLVLCDCENGLSRMAVPVTVLQAGKRQISFESEDGKTKSQLQQSSLHLLTQASIE